MRWRCLCGAFPGFSVQLASAQGLSRESQAAETQAERQAAREQWHSPKHVKMRPSSPGLGIQSLGEEGSQQDSCQERSKSYS